MGKAISGGYVFGRKLRSYSNGIFIEDIFKYLCKSMIDLQFIHSRRFPRTIFRTWTSAHTRLRVDSMSILKYRSAGDRSL